MSTSFFASKQVPECMHMLGAQLANLAVLDILLVSTSHTTAVAPEILTISQVLTSFAAPVSVNQLLTYVPSRSFFCETLMT